MLNELEYRKKISLILADMLIKRILKAAKAGRTEQLLEMID